MRDQPLRELRFVQELKKIRGTSWWSDGFGKNPLTAWSTLDHDEVGFRGRRGGVFV
jgi:hypothetical protein